MTINKHNTMLKTFKINNKKTLILNAKNHILGRLSTHIVKLLKKGYIIKIIEVNSLLISGRFERSLTRYILKKKKKTRTNPNKGPFFMKDPCSILYKTIKGMMAYKNKSNKLLLKNLKCYNSIPNKYRYMQHYVIKKAHSKFILNLNSKYTILSNISRKFGWLPEEISPEYTDYKKLLSKSISFNKNQIFINNNRLKVIK